MQQLSKINSDIKLSDMDDMDNLNKFIDGSITRAITSDQVENLSRLQKLVRLILFNRRQPFQFTDITLDEYKTSYVIDHCHTQTT